MNSLTKLYSRTSTGDIQVWWIDVEDDKYRMNSGKDGGAIVTSAWTVAEPKNVGKKNEVLGPEQAAKEAAAKYTLKRKEGYCDTPEAALADTTFWPMLAHEYKKKVKAATKAIAKTGYLYGQPKLDGIRCIGSVAGLRSRQNNPIDYVPHIREALVAVFTKYPRLRTDGELYNHDFRHDFNTIVSLVKNGKGGEDVKKVQYHIYDIFDEDAEMSFTDRTAIVRDLVALAQSEHIVFVPTLKIPSIENVQEVYDQFLEQEYEGLMVRSDTPYEQTRTDALLKLKEEIDGEFEIVRFEAGKGNAGNLAARVVCLLPDGREFEANVKGNTAYRTQLLADKDKYVGVLATITYTNLTPAGIPRFGRMKAAHLEKGKW